MNQNKDILVSVCMVTYKHEDFIVEAIESIVSQQTDFAFELIIGEDCGPDKTREICIEYQRKYPNIIRLNIGDVNVGAQQNIIDTIKLAKGKYISLCEGDDYWTDKNKLQKQVDFLELNTNFSMCGHAAHITYDNITFIETKLEKAELTIKDILIEQWAIMTASIMFRKEAFDIPDWFVKIKNGDIALQLLLSLEGKIAYLPDFMSVYRQHPGGISATLQPLNQAAWLTYLLYEFNKYTKGKYIDLVKYRINKLYKTQICFAKEYHLRKATLVLQSYKLMSTVAPFLIRHVRQ